MLSNHRDILLSVDNYCSDFNAERYDLCKFVKSEVNAAPNCIPGQIVRTEYAEQGYLPIRVLPTGKV